MIKNLVLSVALAYFIVNSSFFNNTFKTYNQNKITSYIVVSLVVFVVLSKLFTNEGFSLDSNQYICQTKCQQYKDGYIWQWENTNNKGKDMYANCMLECMNINTPMYNMLGYTMQDTVSNEYRYTPSSP
jgi:hypothetical protein